MPNLKKSYATLNTKVAKAFDENGVPRSFTVPYSENQSMSGHVQDVSKVAEQFGGMATQIITSGHKEDGKGWGSAEGETVGHNATLLRHTTIPPNNEPVKEAIDAAQKHLDGCKKLLGKDNPTVAQSQYKLDLLKHGDAAGMNLFDFGVMILQIMQGPTQAVAKAHNRTKPGGASVKLRAPAQGNAPEGGAGGPEESAESESQPEAATGPEGGSQPPQPTQSPAAAPEAAPAVGGAPSEAPAQG